jgi:predicted kinase
MKKSLIIFRGLPGTGKTFLINKIREQIPDLIVISRDIIRSKVLTDHTYNSEAKENLLSIMLFMLEEHIFSKGSIVIDGMTFATKDSIKPFLEAAAKHNIGIKIIECSCSEEKALERIAGDVIDENHLAADREEDLYYHVKETYEPITDFHLKLNTDEKTEINIEKILFYLNAKVVVLKNAD